MGKDGSTWHHGWDPTNPAAVALKMHRPAGSSSRPMQRQQRLRDVKPSPGSHLPLPPSLSGSTAKPKTTAPRLSESYTGGKGATTADIAELSRRYEIMHGKPPTAKQVAKIKRAPTARPRKPAMPKADPMAELLKQARPHQPATPKPPTAITEQHIRDAFTAAGGSHGGFARVTDVKDRMVGTEADKDRALATMFASGKVNLIPQSNQQALTTAQRKRAVRVGGETKHLISLA